MKTVHKLLLAAKNNWKDELPWLIGLPVLFVLLWCYIYAKLINLAVFGALLAALIAFMTLLAMQLSSTIQIRILDHQSKRLQAIEQALKVKPALVVRFATGDNEVKLAADWSEPVETPSNLLVFMPALGEKPLPPGHAPLRFEVTNEGGIAAQEPAIFINVPQGCQVHERGKLLSSLATAAWDIFKPFSCNEIRIRGDSLAPGL